VEDVVHERDTLRSEAEVMQKQIADLIRFQRQAASSSARTSMSTEKARESDVEEELRGQLILKEDALDRIIPLYLAAAMRSFVTSHLQDAFHKLRHAGVVSRLAQQVEHLSGELVELGASFMARPAVAKDTSHVTALSSSGRGAPALFHERGEPHRNPLFEPRGGSAVSAAASRGNFRR
jgi:hypothetical protein